jgi:hypothetical protein
MEEERFFSGTATAYQKVGTWGIDGVWEAAPNAKADYRVRMVVRRPVDPARFNGVLIVEWLNVSARLEGAADYSQMEDEIVRGGYAWVGIGAQSDGINAPGTGLKAWDATRYAPLVHPGDAYSYDIFSQGAQALRHPEGVDPLGGLRIRYMIATGRSQSAFRLVTYINAVHPIAHLFDGYLVHSRSSSASGIAAEGLGRDTAAPIPAGAHIRTDTDVPVLDVQTEGDMVQLRSHLTRQEPGARYRRWEIAGAAHAETPQWVVDVPPALDFGPGCVKAVNSAPHHAVVKAALDALTRWVRDSVVPPQSPAIEVSSQMAPDPLARDAFGLAKGGIRLPELEAPTARIDGQQNAVAQATPGAPNFCFLYGNTVPLDAVRISALYPNHDAFVKKFTAAVDAIVRDGYWLKADGDQARRVAELSSIGR